MQINPRKAVPVTAFSVWLRTGRWEAHPSIEVKYNPWHDAEDGRFTFVGRGRYFPGGSRYANDENQSRREDSNAMSLSSFTASNDDNEIVITADSTVATDIRDMTDDQYATYVDMENWLESNDRQLGQLSAQYESRGNPGTVSTGRGDPGGVSYGVYQFATNTGTAAAFVASPEFGPWAAEFENLRPGTAEFDARWRAVAARDPETFGNAQHAYMRRTHYDPAVSRVDRNTGYDLNTATMAVREATWSVATQHGRAATLLADAVERTDRALPRTDPNYEARLIDNIYDRRTEYVANLRDRAMRQGRAGEARTLNNVINRRYREERAEAHRLLNEQQR